MGAQMFQMFQLSPSPADYCTEPLTYTCICAGGSAVFRSLCRRPIYYGQLRVSSIEYTRGKVASSNRLWASVSGVRRRRHVGGKATGSLDLGAVRDGGFLTNSFHHKLERRQMSGLRLGLLVVDMIDDHARSDKCPAQSNQLQSSPVRADKTGRDVLERGKRGCERVKEESRLPTETSDEKTCEDTSFHSRNQPCWRAGSRRAGDSAQAALRAGLSKCTHDLGHANVPRAPRQLFSPSCSSFPGCGLSRARNTQARGPGRHGRAGWDGTNLPLSGRRREDASSWQLHKVRAFSARINEPMIDRTTKFPCQTKDYRRVSLERPPHSEPQGCRSPRLDKAGRGGDDKLVRVAPAFGDIAGAMYGVDEMLWELGDSSKLRICQVPSFSVSRSAVRRLGMLTDFSQCRNSAIFSTWGNSASKSRGPVDLTFALSC
ncbi:hypothetical protein EDB81DRAFT_467217 [Dactylonectria macrodidyma]|uniref:Uncharacterized protein n=1 Tax=Dactylonectria macrodidyma TaxID=307937 RepID=A0A9P9EZ03_9HYPO|nr:hypothetical protein EDB81DRAFT_467217 [Dactylonectria macrodidyma]